MKTIRTETNASYEEKKSLFLAYIFPCDSKDDYDKRLEEIASKHPEARHILTAYRISPSLESASENREPTKCAHIILEILKKNELVKTGVVMVRYFGGTLLGASNLEKAYLKVFTEAFNEADRILDQKMSIYKIIVLNRFLKPLLKELGQTEIVETKYLGENVELVIKTPDIESLLPGGDKRYQIEKIG